jgi:hypothetical protein
MTFNKLRNGGRNVKFLIIGLTGVLILSAFGCSAADPLTETLYTSDVLPGGSADVGSRGTPYDAGYFKNIYANFITYNGHTLPEPTGDTTSYLNANLQWTVPPVGGGGGAETDPVYSGAAASNVTAGLIANWDDAYGGMVHTWNGPLNFTIGGIASMSQSSNVSDGWLSSADWNTFNAASSAGAGYVPYTGATDNVDINNKNLTNLRKLNMTDPTTLTVSGGAITVTQGFHLVDTEGGASVDDLDTINGGTVGDIVTVSGASDAREVRVTRAGNIRFQPDHVIEGSSFVSPAGSSGTFYAAGFYTAPATHAALTNAAPTVAIGTANTPHGAHMFLVAKQAGTANAGTVSIVLSGTSITDEGVRVGADSEMLVGNITTMGVNQYYQTTKRWLGTVTYTLTPAGGATVYAATFNYGKAVYDDVDKRKFSIKEIEVFGRAGASDTGFDVQLLHHSSTGWTYSAAAFVPGASATVSLVSDYATDNDLVSNERFHWDREVNTPIDGTNGEGFLFRIITTANKAVEFMDISVYMEAIPNDRHLKTTGQALQLIYNGTYWMEF